MIMYVRTILWILCTRWKKKLCCVCLCYSIFLLMYDIGGCSLNYRFGETGVHAFAHMVCKKGLVASFFGVSWCEGSVGIHPSKNLKRERDESELFQRNCNIISRDLVYSMLRVTTFAADLMCFLLFLSIFCPPGDVT